MSTSPELYAFWPYHTPPFAMGSVGHFTATGKFYAKGLQTALDPEELIAVYPLERGKEIRRALEEVRNAHDVAVSAARQKAKIDAIAILPQLKGHLSV